MLSPQSLSGGIAAGPDGALWFTEYNPATLGRITVSGAVSEFPLFGADAPFQLAAGSDGALWFTDVNAIGRFSPTEPINKFATTIFKPTGGAIEPYAIVGGPDGNLWFADEAGTIWKLTPAGDFTSYVLSPFIEPDGIAVGSDGALWFAEAVGDKIGRITTSGVITEYALPLGTAPLSIIAGPDDALWFCIDGIPPNGAVELGRITTDGNLSWMPLPAAVSVANLTSGPDGAIWYTDPGSNSIGRISMTGQNAEYSLPTQSAYPEAITTGPDGAIWFVEGGTNSIGRLDPVITASPCLSTPITLCIDDQPGDRRFQIQVTDKFDSIDPFPHGGSDLGIGTPVPLAPVGITHGGAFWFFSADNPELLVKVLDGCGLNNEKWFFESAATNVGFNVVVTDTQTGGQNVFTNVDGTAALPIQDTSAFTCVTSTSAKFFEPLDGRSLTDGSRSSWPTGTRQLEPASANPCVASDTVLCIDGQPGDQRFEIEVAYQTAQGGGYAGKGHAIPLLPVGITHGGVFWFFSADNPEMLVKVLDGCGANGERWFFASAGTNVGLTVTVTDTQTGMQKIYTNPDGNPAPPIQDTSAFPTCP